MPSERYDVWVCYLSFGISLFAPKTGRQRRRLTDSKLKQIKKQAHHKAEFSFRTKAVLLIKKYNKDNKIPYFFTNNYDLISKYIYQ
jgi:hypothetical protein